MKEGFKLLPDEARDALQAFETADQAERFVREFISLRLVHWAALLALPALAASLSRTIQAHWEPVYTVHLVIVAFLWTSYLLHDRLPAGLVAAALPISVMAYASGETILYGPATGGPVFALFVPILCVPFFGFRRSLYVLTAVLAALSVMAYPSISDPSYLDPQVLLRVVTSPVTWIVLVLAGLAVTATTMISHATLMAALRLRQNTYHALSRQMARDQERFNLVMEGSNDGLWDWDMRTGKVYRSERWFRQIGYRRGDFPDNLETFSNLVHPRDTERLPATEPGKIAEAGPTIESEFRLRHRDGRWVPILSRAFVVMEDGEAVRVVGTHIDLSEREQLVADLRRLETMLTEGIEALPLGLAFFDRTGKLSLANGKYADLMELSSGELSPGTSFESILRAHVSWAKSQCGFSSSEAFVQARLLATSGGPNWEYQQPSGRTIEIFECATSRGGFLSVVADVTDARRRQAELNQAQKMDAVGKLTGGIAHDFNNLLAVIQGNADVLSYSAPEVLSEIDEIRIAARRGAELTQRLLAFSRQQPLKPKAVSPRQLIGDLLPILERALGEAFGIAFDVPQSVWNILVDPGQLENAILNLAINGRDAMSRGGLIEVSARNVTLGDGLTEAEIAPGDYVEVMVADTGSGMTEETRSKAFDPFFTTKEVGHGSGLGLAMVHGFARQSGGGVTIQSKPGSGSRISIYLPRARVRTSPASEPVLKPDPIIGRGEAILVIEDDPSVRAMTCQMLESLGYSVTSAEDAVIGERILLSGQHFDLVLSDIVLPGGKFGHELIRDVREHRRDFRVVFMSGYSPDASDDLRALLETNILLDKPFSLQKLAETMRAGLALPLNAEDGDDSAVAVADRSAG